MASPAHAHEGDEVVVHVTEDRFEPRSVEVEAGETVVFENAGEEDRWPASDDHPTHEDYPDLDPLKPLQPGEQWSFTFDEPGDYEYHDHLAPYLKGEVNVAEGEPEGGFLTPVGGFFRAVYAPIAALFVGEEEAAAAPEDEGRIEAAKGEYAALVEDEGPRVALDRLKGEVEAGDDPELLRSCHDVVHEIGHKAYESSGDFGEAASYQDEVCNSGYLHGVIEGHFSQSDDVFADMNTLCDRYQPEGFLSKQCYHGLGHGVMYYTSNDLPESLEMCDGFETRSGRFNCSNGVFMENFNADQKLHLSEYLDEEDPFYPCAEQTVRDHKRNCYTYAPTYYLSLNANDYDGALEWCGGAETDFLSTCAFGTGAQAMKENTDDPGLVESACMNGDPEQIKPCVEGMVSLYVNHHGSVEPARELCGQQMRESNRQICSETVERQAKAFET